MDVSQTISDVDSNLISNNLNVPEDLSVNKKTTSKKKYFLRTRKIKKQSTDDNKAKKKLLYDKKFPLMEKSQRHLMHLKHNREVPKPRAHVASNGISPVCGYTKYGTSKKVENNSKNTATSARKSTATNKSSVKRNNSKHPETSKKVGRPPLLTTSNKVSATRDNSRKSEIGKKVGNTSRKVSPYESVTAAYKVSEWLDNYFKGSTHENTKDRVIFICRNKTFVTKKCSCPSVSHINDDIRNEFRDSEISDSEYEKFVQSQKEEMNLKKRRKRQPTSTRKKIQQKSKRINAKKDAEVSSDSESESHDDVRCKRCKKRNKCTNDKSRQKSGKNNIHLSKDESESEFEEFKVKSRKKSTSLPEEESQSELEEFIDKSRKKSSTPLPEDESQSEYEDYDDNCVYIRNSSSENMSDNEVVNNLPIKSPQKKSENERVLMSELNSFDVTDSNALFASNPNLNVSSGSTEEKPKNKDVLLSEINALGAKNEISDELSRLVTDFSHANNTEQESPESPVVIDLSLTDDECESVKFTSQFIPSCKTVVTETSTSKSQSDDESDLEIVDVVLSYEKLNVTSVTADSNLSVKKKTKAIVKHEAAFSTDICSKLSEENSEYASLDQKVHNTIEKKVNKKEECDEKAFADISNSSRTASNAGISREANAIGEISTCKKERSLENLTDEAESKSAKEKLLYEVACSNLKIPTTTDNKPTKFSSLSPDDMTNMDVNSLLQMFKTEFQNYKEILETQETIVYSFKLLENRQAEKLLSLKSAIKRYIESFGCSDKKASILDSPMEKIEFGDSRLLESKPGMPSMNAITFCNAGDEGIPLQESRKFSQDSLLPLSSIHQRGRPEDSKLQSTFGSDQKFKEHCNEMSAVKKCIVCSEDAVTACQQCFKVFFCSKKCRKTYWDSGHGRVCCK